MKILEVFSFCVFTFYNIIIFLNNMNLFIKNREKLYMRPDTPTIQPDSGYIVEKWPDTG